MWFLVKVTALTIATILLAGCGAPGDTEGKNNLNENSPFSGRWRVLAVAVPDTGIQALVDNDPGYMGSFLSITDEQLKWETTVQSAEDICERPVFTELTEKVSDELAPQLKKLGVAKAKPYSLKCNTGVWGPYDAETQVFFLAPDGTLVLRWYDGGLLKLVRDYS